MNREEIAALPDRALGQHYYWVLDTDPDQKNEETQLVVAEFQRRELTFDEVGEPFEDMDEMVQFPIGGKTQH